MQEAVETQRTLVKSVPELWAELSEAARLGRMLQAPFGPIAITRLTPESSIEWESELAAGCVELEPSGFGTRVRLTAQLAPAPRAEREVLAPAPTRSGLLARLFRRRAKPGALEVTQADERPQTALDGELARDALAAVLDEVGAARHRPFSRDAGAPPQIT